MSGITPPDSHVGHELLTAAIGGWNSNLAFYFASKSSTPTAVGRGSCLSICRAFQTKPDHGGSPRLKIWRSSDLQFHRLENSHLKIGMSYNHNKMFRSGLYVMGALDCNRTTIARLPPPPFIMVQGHGEFNS